MKKVFHKNIDRGFADHGWLKANHSFSFAGWYNPERIQFGKLRVLNDDLVSPGKGFGTHPHEDMAIVPIPLEGSLSHKDNKGHEEVISRNDIQVMSAGTGIMHSEYNASESEYVNLLQLWIFPDKKGHVPRYDQKSFNQLDRKNKLQTIVAPTKNDNNLWLNQDAYLTWSDLDQNKEIDYNLHNKNNGVYIFLIDGIISVDNHILAKRDAIGVWEIEQFNIAAKENSNILFIEVPMY